MTREPVRVALVNVLSPSNVAVTLYVPAGRPLGSFAWPRKSVMVEIVLLTGPVRVNVTVRWMSGLAVSGTGNGPPNAALSVVTAPVFVVGVWVTNALNGDRLAVALAIVNGAAELLDAAWVASPPNEAWIWVVPGDVESGTRTVARPFEPVTPMAPEPPMPITTSLLARSVEPALSSTVMAGLWPNVPLAGGEIELEGRLGGTTGAAGGAVVGTAVVVERDEAEAVDGLDDELEVRRRRREAACPSRAASRSRPG